MKFYEFLLEGIYDLPPQEMINKLQQKKNKTPIINLLKVQQSIAKKNKDGGKYLNLQKAIDLISGKEQETNKTDIEIDQNMEVSPDLSNKLEIIKYLTKKYDEYDFNEYTKATLKDYKCAAYHPINNYLRTKDENRKYEMLKNRPVTKAQIQVLKDSMRPLKDDVILFRGMKPTVYDEEIKDIISDLQIGDIFQDKGFISTSYLKCVAMCFAKNLSFQILFRIHCKKGQLANFIDFNTHNTLQEFEFVLPAGSNFKVTNIKKSKIRIPGSSNITKTIVLDVDYLGAD